MQNQVFRLEGAYNDQSFQIAHQHNVESITLDFRPRSFNFLPIKMCIELLETWKTKFKNFHILFGEDSELTVTEIYEKVREVVGDRVSLEFEYYREAFDYKSVDLPFHVWVEDIEQVEKSIMQPNLAGIVFNNQFLFELKEEGILSDYFTYIHRLILSNQREDIAISLKLDWDAVPVVNMDKWFHINQYILSISNTVEERYRVIHQENFINKLSNVQSIINSNEKGA